ncbi:hypothetical protein CWC29_019870 [Pseudoalteromonas sp. S4498]|uniref:Uncharacterized protein n=1 Tax=Pseudoalteromonas galatheae TaxID=579562 RepID=A0A8T6YVQ6_9GAMM|nr:hypothetical protein [Pseudoalteromonas galatheae]NKC21042.1 hypothetical protein [Pseudoalteromonas galatheae]
MSHFNAWMRESGDRAKDGPYTAVTFILVIYLRSQCGVGSAFCYLFFGQAKKGSRSPWMGVEIGQEDELALRHISSYQPLVT